jgi:molybdenum cofactor cytidylyltransferase
MGRPKALLKIEGETFIDHLIGTLASECSPVVVVLGHSAEQILAGMSRSANVELAVNPDPERGMLSSLQCGLRQIPSDCEAILFTPVDYPGVHVETVRSLVQTFVDYRAPVMIPTCSGKRGHPVCIRRTIAEEILGLPVDAKARDVIRRYREQTRFVNVPDRGILTDVDEPADYEAFLATMESR